jgi:septal ring factor EnvC (AmiA/AmiB activator)
MSQIARVFAVLNLLFAAGFLFAAGTFLGVKADWIEKHAAEVKAHEKDNADKDATIKTLEADRQDRERQIAALKEEKAKSDATASERRARIEQLETEAADKNRINNTLASDIASLNDSVKRGQDEIRRLTDKNLELVANVAAAQKAEQEAKAAETVAKATITERENTIEAKEKEIHRISVENHEKSLIIDWAREQGVDIAKAVKMEPVNGQVIGVDLGMKLVQFNVGANHKVAKGYKMDVVRGGKYIGRVRIDQVHGDFSAGVLELTAPGESPMVGDRGTTTL